MSSSESPFRRRLYADDKTDAPQIFAYLSRIADHPSFVADFHIGDIGWQRFASTGDDMVEFARVALWEDASGELRGFTLYERDHDLSISFDPALFGTDDGATLLREMVAWAEAYPVEKRKEGAGSLVIQVLGAYAWMQEELTALGFRNQDEAMFNFNVQSLERMIPEPELREGFRFVDMRDERWLEDRVQMHLDVWKNSKLTVNKFRRMMTCPVYRPEFDIAVADKSDRLACYSLGWFDPVTHVGQFEPVGARPEYRQLGLTKALTLEGLRRFKEAGATKAQVLSDSSEIPSNALYRSAGFELLSSWYSWQRPTD